MVCIAYVTTPAGGLWSHNDSYFVNYMQQFGACTPPVSSPGGIVRTYGDSTVDSTLCGGTYSPAGGLRVVNLSYIM